jgi:hypothetical protein
MAGRQRLWMGFFVPKTRVTPTVFSLFVVSSTRLLRCVDNSVDNFIDFEGWLKEEGPLFFVVLLT